MESLQAAAAASGIGQKKVREILANRGITLSEPVRPSPGSRPMASSTVTETAPSAGPGPAAPQEPALQHPAGGTS